MRWKSLRPSARLIGYTTKPLVCSVFRICRRWWVYGAHRDHPLGAQGLSFPADEQSKRRIAYYEYMGTGWGTRALR